MKDNKYSRGDDYILNLQKESYEKRFDAIRNNIRAFNPLKTDEELHIDKPFPFEQILYERVERAKHLDDSINSLKQKILSWFKD